ncbi:FtsX-like permease family protein [Microbacterium pseudoresistens]|uniref:ABC3 transporter permease C-terminal domain-containing protein n=1 Tax=Microbacterium pseudoresistens TaxID=640634 RepID=A0A7Y9EY61_9MICO|nr:FtsX-like permease family protein [Microbacterium pseudoresistens]NYD55235.1 hypothetical protein [Microbacterium pseudoresistens]
MNASTMRMLLRPSRGQGATLVIPMIAFAIVSALILTVVGGAQSFWGWADGGDVTYPVLAAIALVLLVVPLGTLGAGAARLSARRRDERLSTLRLLGVTPAGVAGLTILESTLIAAAGIVVGIVIHLAISPAVGLIPFRDHVLGTSAVVLSPLWIAVIALATLLLATLSAVLGLRRVVISPLGVRMRTAPPRMKGARAVIAAAVIVCAVVVMQQVSAFREVVVMVAVVAAMFACVLLVLNLVGPWALSVLSRRQVRRARTPDRLLAARLVLDDSKAAWRQVSGVAMTSFVAVFAGTGVALMNAMSAEGADAAGLTLLADMRTGLIITLVASFLLVASSVGVSQASEVLDQRELHRSLHDLGVPMSTVDAARRRSIMSPLLITALGSALCAVAVIFPLLGIALIVDPMSLLTIALVLAGGIAIVWLATRATRAMLAPAFAG